MPSRRVEIPFPLGGWHTESAASSQPQGTSPRLLNARPTDGQDADRARGSRRTGCSKFSDMPIESGSPVRAMAGGDVVSRTGNFVVGSAQVADSFTESNTSNGDLGDRFNNATLASGADTTDDYYVYVGSANTKDSFINAAWSTGRGPAIQSNVVVDTISPQTSDHSGAREMWAAVSRLSLSTDTAFVLELQATTPASLSGVQGNVGFIVYANTTTLSGSATDDSSLLMIERIGTGDPNIDCNVYRNNTITQFDVLLEQHEETDEVTMVWEASTTYTFRLYVDGTYGELWIRKGTGDFAFKQRWPSLRRWYKSSTPGAEFENVSNSNTAVGFLMSNVGYDGLFTSVDNFSVYSMEQRSFGVQSVIAAACGNDIYIGDETDGWALATDGTNTISDAPDVSMVLGPTSTDGDTPTVYGVDGESAISINLETGAVSDWAAAATDFPLDDSNNPPKYIVNYNGSACLYGFFTKPGYIVLSRRFDWDDFDITPTAAQQNGREAVPIAMESPVTACIPFRGEGLIVASMARSWVYDGDLRLGGRRLILSESVGCVGPFAWCTDDASVPYWVSLEGLQTISQGGTRSVSLGRIDRYFRGLDFTNQIIRCVWSADDQGVHIFVQNRDEAESIQGLFWHKPTNTFWPQSFPDNIGPTCTATLSRPASASRPLVVIGGWDGYVRKLDRSAITDDGEPIVSYAHIGPFASGGLDDLVLNETRVLTGRTTTGLYVKMFAADDAELLADADAVYRREFAGGGVLAPIGDRVGGGALQIGVGSDYDRDGHWSIERIEVDVEQAEQALGRASV